MFVLSLTQQYSKSLVSLCVLNTEKTKLNVQPAVTVCQLQFSVRKVCVLRLFDSKIVISAIWFSCFEIKCDFILLIHIFAQPCKTFSHISGQIRTLRIVTDRKHINVTVNASPTDKSDSNKQGLLLSCHVVLFPFKHDNHLHFTVTKKQTGQQILKRIEVTITHSHDMTVEDIKSQWHRVNSSGNSITYRETDLTSAGNLFLEGFIY